MLIYGVCISDIKKINEEKAKLEKYTQMMEQVRGRLVGLRK